MDTKNMTREQLEAALEAIKTQNKALINSQGGCKVSEKGAVSFYHGGRFPVTLYADQWELVLSKAGQIRQFILENAKGLKRRDNGTKQNVEVA